MTKGRGKRDLPAGRYVTLREYMLASQAWQALDCNARCLYIEIVRRYRGPDSNNGKIPYSVREAATALRIGDSTACRAFRRLKEVGLIKVGKRSGFNIKGRAATEWLLTEFPDDTKPHHAQPTKDFMRWSPPNSNDSATTGAYSATSEAM